MGKKLKGGRRQILQLEEKKPPKVPSKSKAKSLIHYSDSDEDSKKSNESESSPSGTGQNKDAAPLESQILDFFKEIDALSVPEELLEEPGKTSSSSKTEKVNEITPEASSSDTAVDLPASASKDDSSVVPNKEAYCPWQEICDSSTGYSYYWNVHTNEVTWDCPAEYTAFMQSDNSSTEKATLTAQNDKNIDGKGKKKKKNDIVVPEGAIIPISYFGNSSSSEDSSDSESELLDKKPKHKEIPELKKSKIIRKLESKKESNEGENRELIGPSLPPDFEFPQVESGTIETSAKRTLHQNDIDEVALVGSSLSPKSLSDLAERPSQSDLDEFPAESSTQESSWGNSFKDSEKKGFQLNENTGDESPDSTVKKGESSLNHNAYQVSNSTFGLRSVVEYDSFSDEDEEISVASISSSKLNTDENNCEVKSSDPKEQENRTENANTSKILPGAEIETSCFKRKASEALSESIKKEELIKKPKKRNDVNIDSLFASHSCYGKYGFGFGWQKRVDEQNDELCTSTFDYKTHKNQSELKTVSFVKSEDILDLKALNDEIICDEANHDLPDVSMKTDTECDQSNVLEQQEKPILNNELIVEVSAKENSKISGDYDVDSSNIGSIKDKIDCTVFKKKKKAKSQLNVESTSLKVEDDLDEIDKALCEALDAKKTAKNQSLKSLPPTSEVSNTPKNVVESTPPVLSVEKLKESESAEENAIDVDVDADAITDDILEISSELIDKLTFLLAAPSTHASFNGVFFQLQTRFVDWQAGALESKYFMARLKELEQYILHYETGVISGEWNYQWDRENKRYFFINTRTRHTQWTFPAELCNQDKTPWIQPQAEAGPSSASTFVPEREDLQTVSSSSSTMHENPVQQHSTSSLMLESESKDIASDTRWIIQSSPPPPPPGVDSPPPPPHTPPPNSPPPPPPDSTETLREPEDMDIENSNDSSSFLYVNNKNMDEARMQFLSLAEQSPQRSPISFASAPILNAVSSTSMSGCEDLSTVSKLPQSISDTLDSSEVSNVHWSQPSCSSQVEINCNSTVNATVGTDIPVNSMENTYDSSSNGVCSSQSDAVLPKPTKLGNAVSKKEKKKTKIQPGLGLKKKNIPSLVEKWQKIKKQQEKEDNDSDDCKSGNSF